MPATQVRAPIGTVGYTDAGSSYEFHASCSSSQPVTSIRHSARDPINQAFVPSRPGIDSHSLTGQSNLEQSQTKLTQHGSTALAAAPAHTAAAATPPNRPATGKMHKCRKCEESFPDKESRQAHVKEIHQVWHCTWPGCKRK